MDKRITKSDKAFVQGLFFAAGFMADIHGEMSYARDIIEEAGYTFGDGKRHDVDESDIARVRPAFGNEDAPGAGEKGKEAWARSTAKSQKTKSYGTPNEWNEIT